MMISEKNKNRIDSFLLNKINKKKTILACGCGDGSEVYYLRKSGYKAYGLDPSRLENKKFKSIEKFLSNTKMGVKSFKNKKFDFIYAFEVLEHVGCRNYGTYVEKNFIQKRKNFLRASIEKLNKDGVNIITTLNKNFLIDWGHLHRYHLFGKIFGFFFRKGLSFFFMKDNFLLNYQEIRTMLNSINSKKLKFKYRFLDMTYYPSMVRKKNNSFSYFIKIFLRIVNKEIFRETFLNPLIGIKIKKIK